MTVSDEAGTDTHLVAAVRGGDDTSFEELYRLHLATVQRVVASHVRAPEAAADAVQETFVRVLNGLSTLRDPSRFRPWLLAIARNAAVDQLRLAARCDTLTEAMAHRIVSPGPDVDEVAEDNEQRALVADAIGQLGTRDATLLGLVGHLGFTPEEVGVALGMSSNATRVALHRARRRVRDNLLKQMPLRSDLGAASSLTA